MPFADDCRDRDDFHRDGVPLDGAAAAERLRELAAELRIEQLRQLLAYAEQLRSGERR